MGLKTKVYIYAVIAAGASVLAASMANWSSPDLLSWSIYLVLAVLASVVKLRLPGMDGTYSLGFLFLLYGMAHFRLPETLLAGCAGAVAGSLLNTKKRSSAVQVLFNTANLAISVGACFLIVRVCLASGLTAYLPAVIAIVACVYFLINTALVSGVLSLLQGKRLAEVCNQWYVWSLPYYLIGVALVGLFPSPGQATPGEAWLVLLPLIYLVHFFLGLVEWHASSAAVGDQPNASLPRAARALVMVVVASGVLLLGVGVWQWHSQSPVRFVSYLTLAVVASTLKIRLPGMRGTISPSFVLVLMAIVGMSFGELTVMATVVGVVQVLWRSARRPMLAQVLFNPASQALSAGLAYGLCRILLAPWLGHTVVGELVVGTLVLYGANSLLLAAVLAMVDRKPLGAVWQLCYFWSLPYYLVGAAVAGIMMATSRMADWPPSLLVLPLMGLVYISYRVHVRQAVDRIEQLPA
jgi:hypothetical protein